MNEEYKKGGRCYGSTTHEVQFNTLEVVRKYKLLESAVSQGQGDLVESLLESGAAVNGHPVCNQLRTPLHSSIRLGDVKIVEKLLSAGASVNVEYFGDTPLTLAAKLGKLELVDLLLLAAGLENSTSHEKITHFHIACMRNRIDVVQRLLQFQQDVNAVVDSDSRYWPGFTPLHFAVQSQCSEIVEFLLNIGANIIVQDARHSTPLHLAYVLGNEQIIDMILSIHHRIANNPVDKTGLSHFHIACTRKKLNIVEHFIDLGVDIRFPKTRRRKTPSIFDLPETLEHKTAMDLAIRHERVEVVKLLLQYGAQESSDDVEEFDHIKHAYSTGNMRIVELLIGDSKLSRKIRKFETNYLALLAHGNHERLAKWACDTRSSLNLPITQSGCTLLHLAIEQGYRNICSFLVEQGSDFTIQDARRKSSLHLAFEHNWKELMDLMLKNRKKLSKNIIDSNGVSFLHIACARNDVESVKLLLEGDADVNAPVKSNAPLWAGYTPLHFTAKFGCEKVAYILLKSGASYTAVNASNLNAFDIALMVAKKTSSSGAFNCMKLLLISHRKFKDERFNDRGISLLHLASLKVSSKAHSYSTGLGELGQLLDTHARDINKAIHKMNLSWDGYTPLHFAVQNYETRDHANLLIRAGADVLAQDGNGDTPMHLSERSMPFPDATFDRSDLRYLKLNHIGANGLSIFHTACIRGNLNLMKYFLDHGVDANCRTLFKGLGYEEEAPLHLVIRGSSDSSLDAVKLLLQYGADPNMNDFHKNTPLHLMHHCNRHPEIIELLVSNGADVNAYNARCDTPLLRLFLDLEHNFYKCSDFIRHIISFLNYGSNVDVENKKGATPFSIAYSGWGSLDPSDEQEWDDIVHIIDILLRHVIRLEIIGIHMSERNKDFNNLLLSTFSNDLSFKKDSLIKVCKKELQLLRQIRKNNITYHDILLGNPHKLASISQNSLYQSIINSNAFCEKYPVYGPLVKSRLVEGKVRWRLLDGSAKNLNIMLRITLPRICSDNILRYLGNQDLRNIIKSKKNAS